VCRVLQCVAVCVVVSCSVLQRVAVCVVVCCSCLLHCAVLCVVDRGHGAGFRCACA